MSEKKILFLESEEDNIYRNYASDERETVFQIFFFFFGIQSIENMPYFYKSFLLIKDSFLLTKFYFYFLCYQALENVENYLYRRFSSETNRAQMLKGFILYTL